MAERDKKRFYWLKLKEDFFKRHDVRIVESMPNGKDYIIFYLKLLCESCSHEGKLRFNSEIPYNEEMLATITNTNVDIVRSAVKIFSSLHLMEVLDDGTYFMTKVETMIGSETGMAKRLREYRKKQQEVTSGLQCNLEIEKDIDIDKEIDIEKEDISNDISKKEKTKRFSKPSINEIESYCKERKNNVDPQRFFDYYESKGWVVGKAPMKDWKAAIRTWEKTSKPKESEFKITQFDV